MREMKRFISLLTILFLFFYANGQTKPWLHVDGNLIKDSAENPVILSGVSIIAPEFAANNPNNPLEPSEYIDWLADSTRGWYSSIVRIPVCGLNQTPAAAYTFINPLVQQAIDLGLYVIIDFHNVTDYGSNGTSQEAVMNFWNYFAPKYADFSNVLFEVFNEPINPANWNQWKNFIQPVVDSIRTTAPKNIILMGSPQWSTYSNHAVSDPILGENIVYVFHIYPNQGVPYSYLLDSKFGNAAESIPIMITEFGWNEDATYSDHVTYGKTSTWGVPFREYLDAHPHISWVNWLFDNYWMPSLFDENWNLMASENQGEFIKGWLEDLNKIKTNVGVAHIDASQLKVAAQNGQLTISMDNLSRVDIYSMAGILISSKTTKGDKIVFNNNINNGSYIVRAYNCDGLAAVKKILIMN